MKLYRTKTNRRIIIIPNMEASQVNNCAIDLTYLNNYPVLVCPVCFHQICIIQV